MSESWPQYASPRSSINLRPVANLHHEDAQNLVLNVANYPTVTYPITPEAAKWTRQCLARAARVVQPGNSFIHLVDNAPCRLLVELAKLSLGRIGVINRPG